MEFVFDRARADEFLETMRRRYACKRFGKGKKLAEATIRYILECGRLSPSSFGLEPWHFVAVASPEKIASLGDACFAQEAVSSSACAVVILVRREAAFEIDAPFLKSRSERFPGGYGVFLDDYRNYHSFLSGEGRILEWSRAQSYIACANMMTGASFIGLDSCAIEGFDEEKVLALLGKDAAFWAAGLVVAFGERDESVRQKIREPIDSISEIMTRGTE